MYLLNSIRNNFKTKNFGFYIALASFAMTIIYSIFYLGCEQNLFNMSTVIWGFAGCALFFILTLFSETSQIAPFALVAANLFGLVGIIQAEDFTDYMSTVFFSGFSFEVLFSIESSFLIPLLGTILSLIISCFAVYLPQNKKVKEKEAK